MYEKKKISQISSPGQLESLSATMGDKLRAQNKQLRGQNYLGLLKVESV